MGPIIIKYSFCLIGEVVQNEVRLEIFVFRLMAISPSHYLSPDETLFKGDIYLPVFSWKTQPYQWDEIIKILLGSYEEEYLCKSQPIDISNNITFLTSNSSFKNVKDIVCDDMGAWKHNGSPLQYLVVDKSSEIMI